MSIDLSAWKTCHVSFLVARLCEEARVCLDRDPLPHDDQTYVAAATWDVEQGLVVTDEDGKKFRLRITAEEIK